MSGAMLIFGGGEGKRDGKIRRFQIVFLVALRMRLRGGVPPGPGDWSVRRGGKEGGDPGVFQLSAPQGEKRVLDRWVSLIGGKRRGRGGGSRPELNPTLLMLDAIREAQAPLACHRAGGGKRKEKKERRLARSPAPTRSPRSGRGHSPSSASSDEKGKGGGRIKTGTTPCSPSDHLAAGFHPEQSGEPGGVSSWHGASSSLRQEIKKKEGRGTVPVVICGLSNEKPMVCRTSGSNRKREE